MSLITGTSEQIKITQKALERIKILLEKENKPKAGLRLYISGGGCAGMSYGMSIDDAISSDDAVVNSSGVKVVVDKLSLIYLRGSTIDYEETLQTSGFKVDNPNAAASCGCGLSFKAKKETSDEAKQVNA
ncbi:MAG: iron-sulfur cluster insertion protein ErpA [Nitrososphaerales archaeon]